MSENPILAQAETTTKVSSAVTPALVLAGTTVAGGAAGLQFGPDSLSEIFTWLMVGGPVLAAFQIVFFTIFDRDRLHSERHLERKMMISKIRPQLGDAGTVIELDATLEPTANPLGLEGKNV